MDLLSLIYRKREGKELSSEDIHSWIRSLRSKRPPPEYQTAVLLSFIFQQGMNNEETRALTEAMLHSGQSFRYKGFEKDAVFLDKHSTGGVGDKVSLCLAPLVASCADNVFIPMLSGRGLGHTGGTIDKLESIPGLRTDWSVSKFYRLLRRHQLCFSAPTRQVAPADKELYALRDVTGTVESIPLITASILSKKLSESLNFLLLDVKVGSGAFMPNRKKSRELARSLVEVATLQGVETVAYLTDMDSPLGEWSGHRAEVEEAMDVLKGEGPKSTTKVTMAFASRMLQATGLSKTVSNKRLKDSIATGAAYERWKQVVQAQGGSLKSFDEKRKRAKLRYFSLKSPRHGYLQWSVRQMGLALGELGGGRKKKEDRIDYDVALYHPVRSGNWVEKGQEVLRVYYRNERKRQAGEKILREALKVYEEPLAKTPLVLRKL